MKSIGFKFRLGIVLTIVCATATLSGCVGLGSTTLPKKLSQEQKAQVKNVHLPFVIGVERYQYPVYSDALVSALKKLNLFAEVNYRDRLLKKPSLVAEIEKTVYGNPTIPVATLLSFGIVPTKIPETQGYVFSLHSPRNETNSLVEGLSFRRLKNENQKTVIDFRYQAKTTLGWIAAFKALSANEVLGSPESNSRFQDSFKLHILEKADELNRLVESEKR